MVVEHSDALPDGAHIVVRALPAAATAAYDTLDADFSSALTAAWRRAAASGPRVDRP